MWCIFLGLIFLPLVAECRNVGSFFHITDFHLDTNYSEFGNLQSWCHAFSNGVKGPDIGKFGNYICDSPITLIQAVVDGMKSRLPNPDFIIWTGDSLPHVNNSAYNMNAVINTIDTVTKAIKHGFPITTTFPVLGNHDYWPANALPNHTNPVYNATVQFWNSWLHNQTGFNVSSLNNYGYYSAKLASNVTLLVLNTNLYYNFNPRSSSFGPDPGYQFQWLQNQLTLAKSQNYKVVIMGHIAPGAFERTANITWFWPNYNAKFVKIITQYSDVILMSLFGHDHTDSFRLVRNAQGNVATSILLAPAVTPWRSPLPGAGANNPSFRIIDYDKSTWEIVDIHQYFTNLEQANTAGQPLWNLEYSYSSAYGLNTVTTSGLEALVNKFKSNDTLFQRYFHYNSVSVDQFQCTGECKKTQLCTIQYVDYAMYNRCLQAASGSSTTNPPTTPSSSSGPNKPKIFAKLFIFGILFLSTLYFLS